MFRWATPARSSGSAEPLLRARAVLEAPSLRPELDALRLGEGFSQRIDPSRLSAGLRSALDDFTAWDGSSGPDAAVCEPGASVFALVDLGQLALAAAESQGDAPELKAALRLGAALRRSGTTAVEVVAGATLTGSALDWLEQRGVALAPGAESLAPTAHELRRLVALDALCTMKLVEAIGASDAQALGVTSEALQSVRSHLLLSADLANALQHDPAALARALHQAHVSALSGEPAPLLEAIATDLSAPVRRFGETGERYARAASEVTRPSSPAEPAPVGEATAESPASSWLETSPLVFDEARLATLPAGEREWVLAMEASMERLVACEPDRDCVAGVLEEQLALMQGLCRRRAPNLEQDLACASMIQVHTATAAGYDVDTSAFAQAAIEAAEETTRRHPRSALAQQRLASAYALSAGHLDARREALRRCVDLDPQARPCRDALSRLGSGE